MPVDEKQELYKRIEELEKQSYDKTQDILLEILPEAFAVVKDTARRFAENEEVEVAATYLSAWDLGLGLGVFAGGALAERFSFSFGYCVADLVLLLGLVYFVSVVVPHYKKNIVGSGQ